MTAQIIPQFIGSHIVGNIEGIKLEKTPTIKKNETEIDFKRPLEDFKGPFRPIKHLSKTLGRPNTGLIIVSNPY